MLDIQKVDTEEQVTLKLVGRLDTNTAPDLEKVFGEIFEQKRNNILIDMEKCDFVSSAGLRVTIAAVKAVTALQGRLVFTNVQETVMDVFTMTGFDKILTFA